MSWAYGLIEEEGRLFLSEIYFDSQGKYKFSCDVDWRDIEEEDIELLKGDIIGQLDNIDRYKFKR